MNKYSTFSKVISCINSCKTFMQWESSYNLVRLHYSMYKDKSLKDIMDKHYYKWLKKG